MNTSVEAPIRTTRREPATNESPGALGMRFVRVYQPEPDSVDSLVEALYQLLVGDSGSTAGQASEISACIYGQVE